MASSLRIEFIMPFVESTKETFATMLSTEVHRRQVYIKPDYAMYGDVSGIIGLAGPTTGTCALSLPATLAGRLIRATVLEPEGEALSDSDVKDGVGELINRIAGGAKKRLSKTPYKFNITLPTIISGGHHEVFHPTGAYCVVILFQSSNGPEFTLDVCVSQK